MSWNVFWELGVEETQPEKPRITKPCAVVRPNFLSLSTEVCPLEVAEPSETAALNPTTASSAAPVTFAGQTTTGGTRTLAVLRSDGNPESNTETKHIRLTISNKPTCNEYASEGCKLYIRRIVNHCIANEQLLYPHSDIVHVLKRKLKIRGTLKEFKRRLCKMGYFWFVTKNSPNKNILVESAALRLHREEYLQTIQRYRAEGRPIIYLSKYFDYFSQRGRDRCNTFTLNANSGTGLAPHSIDMYEIANNNNLEQEQFLICQNWIRQRVIPNIPPNAVIVLVNLPCQNKLLSPPPRPDATKLQMRSWLLMNGVPIQLNMYKPQLYQLILKSKDKVKRYAIDELFKGRTGGDHPVLRCPPQHYDLDISHLFWSDAFYKLIPRPRAIRDALYDSIQNHLFHMTVSKLNLLQRQLIENERDYARCDLDFDTLTDHFKLACDQSPYPLDLDLLNLDTRTLVVSSAIMH
ncbi:uncharacterized protein LOC106717067 [Papilio machaon]|uniref:uncharacterized protein LOC106717067 n=1 Tax=Papilio machaon TaxID=76193 RepID=UPI001E6661E1|nr:uncharacterized protein LOC106717067 [Papilio machaon]XP_014366246.2 uncharacterized protein LOC106717067 [Papilio machaon]